MRPHAGARRQVALSMPANGTSSSTQRAPGGPWAMTSSWAARAGRALGVDLPAWVQPEVEPGRVDRRLELARARLDGGDLDGVPRVADVRRHVASWTPARRDVRRGGGSRPRLQVRRPPRGAGGGGGRHGTWGEFLSAADLRCPPVAVVESLPTLAADPCRSATTFTLRSRQVCRRCWNRAVSSSGIGSQSGADSSHWRHDGLMPGSPSTCAEPDDDEVAAVGVEMPAALRAERLRQALVGRRPRAHVLAPAEDPRTPQLRRSRSSTTGRRCGAGSACSGSRRLFSNGAVTSKATAPQAQLPVRGASGEGMAEQPTAIY